MFDGSVLGQEGAIHPLDDRYRQRRLAYRDDVLPSELPMELPAGTRAGWAGNTATARWSSPCLTPTPCASVGCTAWT